MIFPGGEYTVQLLGGSCDSANETHYTSGLVITNTLWADFVGARIAPAGGWAPPNADVNVIDLLGMQMAISSLASIPIKSRTDLEGVGSPVVDGVLGVTEYLRVQLAAQRFPYPYAYVGPVPPEDADGEVCIQITPLGGVSVTEQQQQ